VKTDALFYRVARELPEHFFELIGRPAAEAARYRFDAIELKDTAVRIDGVYLPVAPDVNVPVYFVEFQNQHSERTYSNLLLKIGLYLEKVNPRQDWQAVVIYPDPSVEQKNLQPYRCLLRSDQLTRIYLSDLPEARPGQLGIAILKMMTVGPADALSRAQQLIPRLRAARLPAARAQQVIELIETVVLYQFPQMSRKELETMLQVNDFRETKVYQEALEEGMEKGMEKGRQVGAIAAAEDIARRLLVKGLPAAEIVELTGLSLTHIKKLKKRK
jgi:predicted transposase/invertase (TIGR01784 family)